MDSIEQMCERPIVRLTIDLPNLEEDEPTKFEYKIIGIDEDEVIIGEGSGWIFPFVDSKEEFVDLGDRCTQDCYELCCEIDPTTIDDLKSCVIIEKMFLQKDFRKKGVGLKVMNAFIDYFWNNILLIKPYPLNSTCPESERDVAQEHLQNYWSKCGFIRYEKSPIFYKDCSLR